MLSLANASTLTKEPGKKMAPGSLSGPGGKKRALRIAYNRFSGR